MALVHPLGFGTCRPEYRQILLEIRSDPTTSRSCASPILPSGFPLFLDSRLAWSTSEIQVKLEHTYHLTHEDRAEIDNALDSFKGFDHPSII